MCIKVYQKHNISKLKHLNLFDNFDFLISLGLHGHIVTLWKSLSNVEYETRGLGSESVHNICQYFMKSDNLLHKLGFVDSQMKDIVNSKFCG